MQYLENLIFWKSRNLLDHPLTDDIANIIGVRLTELFVFGINIDPRAWVTLVCIEFLEKFCQDEKDVWELVVLKAQTWLNKNFPNLGPEAKMVAKDFVSKNVRQSQKTCPLGHQLFLVPSTKVGSEGWYCDRKSLCSGGHGNAGLYANVQVWRCENDWRMTSGGSCDFDLQRRPKSVTTSCLLDRCHAFWPA